MNATTPSSPDGVPLSGETLRVLGLMLRDVMQLNAEAANFRVMGPDETSSNRLDALFQVTGRDSAATILDTLAEHHAYIRAHGDDMPDVRDWQWPA